MITQEKLQELYEYVEEGHFIYKSLNKSSNKLLGKKVGSLCKLGYFQTKINSKSYLVHRLIYLFHHGYLPKYVDHIDGNPSNNKIENLRAATNAQNCQNQKRRITNKSGFKNVYWHKIMRKWRVDITVNGKKTIIGYFDDVNKAGEVALRARIDFYKEFAKQAA